MKIGRTTGPRNVGTPAAVDELRPRSARPLRRRGDATPAAGELAPTPPAQAAAPSCAPRRSAAPARGPVRHASARQRGPEGDAAQRPPGARTPAGAPSGPSAARTSAGGTGCPAGAREGASGRDKGGAGHPAGEGEGYATGNEGHATRSRAGGLSSLVLIPKQYLAGNSPETPAGRAGEAAAAPAAPERRPPRNPELAAAEQDDPQLGRLNYRKRYAADLAEQLDAAGRPKLAARVHRCSDTLCLDERGKVMHRQACRVRVCPICQAFRASRWAGQLHAGLIAMQATEPGPLAFAHLTVTVRNCAVDELRERTSAVHRALERMARRAIFPALGYVRNTEVTVNLDTREVHPHTHMLLALPASYYAAPWHLERPSGRGRPRIVPGYMTHAEYVELWRDCAKLDYAPSVSIQAVNLDTPEGRGTLYEVAKYGVKPASISGMPPEMLGTFLTQIHKRRSIAVTGIINRYVRQPDEGEEPDERNAEASATWEPGARRYVAAPLREEAE